MGLHKLSIDANGDFTVEGRVVKNIKPICSPALIRGNSDIVESYFDGDRSRFLYPTPHVPADANAYMLGDTEVFLEIITPIQFYRIDED
ncbi:MAG: hypothetical protein ACXABY_26400 [Candidatus Thorarchaeota archaeon]|jgi:hypothetical protein